MKKVNNDMERLINNYIAYLKDIKNLSPKSIKSYIPVVKEMIEYCGFKRIDDIQNSTIIQLQNWLNKKRNEGLSNQSLNRRIASCKSFYGYLCAFRIIDFNASKELKQLRIESKGHAEDTKNITKIRNYVKSEYNLKKNFNNLRNILIVEILFQNALRNFEIRSLNVDTIDRETGEYTITQKGGSKKQCVLSDKALDLYNKYLDERLKINAKDNSLFISSYKQRLSSSGLEKIISNITKSVGITNFTPHTARHTSLTAYMENGFNVTETAKLAGHSDPRTTYSFYYHPNTDTKRKMVSIWD